MSHPEWKAKGSVVRLKTHWPSLLKNGLMGCMKPLPNSWSRVVVVVMVSRGRVIVVIIVHRLVCIVVLLFSEEVGVKVTFKTKKKDYQFLTATVEEY